MTATEALRKEVKKYIDQANDKSLRMVKALLEGEQEDSEEDEDWDDLPKELQELIENGIKEGEEGKVISYEQIKEKYSQWFRK